MTRLLRTYGYDVRTYSSTYQFLSRQLALVPACLVLDLKMPGIGGLKVQEILSNRDGYLPIIFVSSQADVEESVRAMKAGAIDFLMKPFDCDKLLSAIQAALAVSERVLRKKDEFKKDQAAFVTLTRREREVCIRIAQGLLNKQVGFELGTAEKTVKAQRARVMHKLGAGSIVDVVKFVERLRVAGGLPQT
jgi:FixJ family two-component response regulator